MKILKSLDLNNVVFLDIETVAGTDRLTEDNPMWDSWKYKMEHGREPIGGTDVAASYIDKAALFAEFGKIVCITIGKIVGEEIKLKSYADHDEKVLLTNFCADLDNIIASNKNTVLCGHAIKGFDLPWIMRRCIVHQVELPTLIDTAHLKPWETTAIDTMDLWKGTGFNGGSLIAIAVALGLHNPKDEMEGFQTTKAYYEDKDGLVKIQTYCEKDVVTVANIVRKCRYEPIVTRTLAKIDTKKVGQLERVFNTKKIDKTTQGQLLDMYKTLEGEEAKIAKTILEVVVPK
jgi:hypothetical protein